MVLLPVEECTQAAPNILAPAGVPPEHAQMQADLPIDAELRGVPAHGMPQAGAR